MKMGIKIEMPSRRSGPQALFLLPSYYCLVAIGLALGAGSRVGGTESGCEQGEFEITNDPYNVAIDGEGFFQVIGPSTNRFLYTRAGNFAVSSDGILVIGSAATGRILQPQISIPADAAGLVISAEGQVWVQQLGQTWFSQIGQLRMAKFPRPKSLRSIGENLFQETLSSGAAIVRRPGAGGLDTLRQNALERSNAEPTS